MILFLTSFYLLPMFILVLYALYLSHKDEANQVFMYSFIPVVNMLTIIVLLMLLILEIKTDK